MRITLRKSAFLPLLSVRVAWSITCSRMLNRSGWAFSISSKQQDAVGVFADAVGQQPALVEADVSGRRADQARHGVLLHVLAHVEADELDPQGGGQLPGHLGLADAGRPGEQEASRRVAGDPQARAGALDGGDQRADGIVLAEDHAPGAGPPDFPACCWSEADTLCGRECGPSWPRSSRCRPGLIFLRLGAAGQPHAGAGLVDHVDGLVGQVAVVDVLGRQLGRGLERRRRCRRCRGAPRSASAAP